MAGTVTLPFLTGTDDGCFWEFFGKVLDQRDGIIHIYVKENQVWLKNLSLTEGFQRLLKTGSQLKAGQALDDGGHFFQI